MIECGHKPGVLSGAELAAKARVYGAHYARQRRVAEEIAKRCANVVSGRELINSRWCRVWLDAETGDRVELFFG